jgi:hypothetical protein
MLLIALGAAGLWGVLSGRVYGHSHLHSGEQVAHWHLHVGARTSHPAAASHSHLPTIIGAAFAISSLRALTMLAPFGEEVGRSSLPVLLALIGVFAVGILLSMSLFGVAFARVVTAPAIVRLGRVSGLLLAAASMSLGSYWIATAF